MEAANAATTGVATQTLLSIASGGLLLFTAAHIVADATIYVILIND
jgi:hypothetical protein